MSATAVHIQPRSGDLIAYAQLTPPVGVSRIFRKEVDARANNSRGLYKLAARAGLEGFARVLSDGTVSRTAFDIRWKFYCDSPVRIERSIRSGARFMEGQSWHGRPGVEVTMDVPCRKCEKCRQLRRLRWRDRAQSEIAAAPRTWFVTLTFDPEHLAGIHVEAQRERGEWDVKVDTAAYRHVQKYLKRLRKAANTRFRYLAVYERGEKTGRAHYHLLLHEIAGQRPILKRTLEGQWRSHVHARLVAGDGCRQAVYLTAYATKSALSRPRASNRYGDPGGKCSTVASDTRTTRHQPDEPKFERRLEPRFDQLRMEPFENGDGNSFPPIRPGPHQGEAHPQSCSAGTSARSAEAWADLPPGAYRVSRDHEGRPVFCPVGHDGPWCGSGPDPGGGGPLQ